MKGVLNSIGLLEFITVELKSAVGLDSGLIVVLVKNGHLGSVLFLRLGNRLLGNGIIIDISVNELNVGVVMWSVVMVVVGCGRSTDKSNDCERKGSHINLL